MIDVDRPTRPRTASRPIRDAGLVTPTNSSFRIISHIVIEASCSETAIMAPWYHVRDTGASRRRLPTILTSARAHVANRGCKPACRAPLCGPEGGATSANRQAQRGRGLVWVYGAGDEGVMALTDVGIETVIELIRMHKDRSKAT